MRADPRLLIERGLLVVGVACLAWYGLVTAEARHQERQARESIERAIGGSGASGRTDIVLRADPPPADELLDGHLVGMLEIPRLQLSTPVAEGDDEKTLKSAAGHLPDTPRPWEAGNSAIAAHRDGLFRPLRNIRVGDEVRLRTARGELRYTVRSTRIVMPTDLSVLDQSGDHALTLITCYPFNYIGSAPKRFIVRAERIP